jgi:hypothetical protein
MRVKSLEVMKGLPGIKSGGGIGTNYHNVCILHLGNWLFMCNLSYRSMRFKRNMINGERQAVAFMMENRKEAKQNLTPVRFSTLYIVENKNKGGFR